MIFGEPARIRTVDILIKSEALYQLSYGLPTKICDCKIHKKGKCDNNSPAMFGQERVARKIGARPVRVNS